MLWLRWNIVVYYRSESMHRQDIVIPVFCLTTWAGKMGLSCPLRISHVDLAISPFGLSLRWLDLFLPHSFLSFYQHWLHLFLVLKNTKKNLNNIQWSWPHICSIIHMSKCYNVKLLSVCSVHCQPVCLMNSCPSFQVGCELIWEIFIMSKRNTPKL